MPLPFSIVCDLLEQCHKLSLARKKNYQAVTDWFARNRSRIDAHDTNLAALLSTLLPEKRTDRVYCIQAPRLEKIIGRALFLGSSRIPQLTAYKQPGLGLDLADCVEHILTATVSAALRRLQDTTKHFISQIQSRTNHTKSRWRRLTRFFMAWRQRSDGVRRQSARPKRR